MSLIEKKIIRGTTQWVPSQLEGSDFSNVNGTLNTLDIVSRVITITEPDTADTTATARVVVPAGNVVLAIHIKTTLFDNPATLELKTAVDNVLFNNTDISAQAPVRTLEVAKKIDTDTTYTLEIIGGAAPDAGAGSVDCLIMYAPINLDTNLTITPAAGG